jgi:clathrin heavy chain
MYVVIWRMFELEFGSHAVVQLNIEAVNDAYNSILIDEEDYNTLRDSIDSFDRYDPMALAKKLEKHPVLEFRRLAAHLYKVRTLALAM